MSSLSCGDSRMILVSLLLVSFFWGEVFSSVGFASKRFDSTCDTIPAEIHLSKDEYDQNSVLVRTCEANVPVNKCEGACASSIQPSALTSTGFQKECHCCREGSYRERAIQLSSCFDGDGQRISGAMGSMDVNIQEPIDCSCHECGK